MELDIQTVSILIGVIILLVLAIDGIRRSVRARRSEIRMNLNLQDGLDKDVLEELARELPSGGARVVDRESGDYIAPEEDEVPVFKAEQGEIDFGPMDLPDEGAAKVNLDDVPTLTESVAEPSRTITQEPGHNLEPADEVLTMFVRARSGNQFGGHEVVEALLRSGVNYGNKKIFHAHFDDKLQNEVSFSVANMVEPGYFDIEALSEFSTTGLIFFMSLPKQNPNTALQKMVEAARATATALDGEVFDSDLSVFTQQTLSHYETRLHDFTRDQLRKQRESATE